MTKKSSQELLNEILLHMRYDSSLTLSENKEMLVEQNTFYYDNLGNLKGGGPITVPTGARMASKLFPNLNQSQYPKKILTAPQVPKPTTQQTQIPTVNRNPKYQQLLRDYNLPADLETKKDANAIIANRLVSGEYDEFKNKLKTIYPELYTKLQPKTVQKPKSNVGPKVDTRSYSDATRIAPGSFGTPGQELASDEQMAVLKFMTPKKVDAGFNSEFEVPGTSKLYYWDENDHNDVKLFSNSVTFKNGSLNDWTFFIISGNKYQKDYVMPIGKVKGFSFNYKSVDLTFKRTVTSEEFLNEFGAMIDGKYYKYVKSDFLGKTDWEDLGPTLLNVGSIVLALLPATWPLLLASAGMDLYAAKMQYEQGETEGAKISVLLALTPFIGKLGIKVSSSASKNLINKFAKAVTNEDVNNVVLTLSKEELSTLKSLRELGNLKSEVKTLAASKEVKDAINTAAKKAPGLGKTALTKGGLELSLAGGVLYTQWDNLKEEILAEMTNKQLIEQYIVYLKKLTTDQETIDKLNEANKLMVGNSTKFVGDLLEKIIKEAEKTKKLQTEGINEEIEKMNQYLQTSTEPINSKIGLEKSKTLIDTVNTLGNNLPNIPNELNKPK